MIRVTEQVVLFWTLCAAIGFVGGVSLRYTIAGAVLALMLLVMVVYVEWTNQQ